MPCQGHPVGVCVRTRRALSAWSSSAARWRLGRCGNLIKDSNSHWQCAIRCAQCRVQGVRGQGSKLPNSASQKHRRQWCRGSQIRQGALSGGRTLSKNCPPNVHLRACFVRTPEKVVFRDRSARRNFGGQFFRRRPRSTRYRRQWCRGFQIRYGAQVAQIRKVCDRVTTSLPPTGFIYIILPPPPPPTPPHLSISPLYTSSHV